MAKKRDLKKDLEKIIVVIADDSVMTRDFIVAGLKQEPDITLVKAVDNGKQLIDWLQVSKLLPDVCIIDGCMPEMDGFQAITKIKDRWPEIKTIGFSVYDFKAYIEHMELIGADAFLTKSMSGLKLARSIRELYHHGTCRDSLLYLRKQPKVNAKDRSVLLQLTSKQMEVWKHACTKATFNEIAVRMKTSYRAVQGYRNRLYEIIDVENRVDLVILAFQYGLITINSNGEREWRYDL